MASAAGLSQGDLISSLSRAIDEVLRPLVSEARPCALLGYPNHANVGDSAIWLGEMAYFRRTGVSVGYTCDAFTYSPEELEARLDRGTIFLHGGGDLGDVWPPGQHFREKVIAAFPNRRVVQLPQTIHFMKKDNLDRARAIFNQHPDLTILVRDKRSLELARNEFRARSMLCPDMAFALGPLARPEAAKQQIVWLLRTDHESAGYTVPLAFRTTSPRDWLRDYPSLSFRVANRLGCEICSRLRILRRLPPLWARACEGLGVYQGLAQRRLLRGCRILGRGAVVITDRLHGHILSLLMGIPHVLLDNSYGKLRGFFEAWTSGCELSWWAGTSEEALERARVLVG